MKQWMRTYIHEVSTLLHRDKTLFFRRPWLPLLHAIVPLFVLFLLIETKLLYQKNEIVHEGNSPKYSVSPSPLKNLVACSDVERRFPQLKRGKPCLTFAYSPNQEPWISLMESFRMENGFKDNEVQGFSSPAAIDEHITFNQVESLVLGAYLFDTVTTFQMTEKDINLDISYTIQFNKTRTQSSSGEIWNPYEEVMLPMQYHMDMFLMKRGGLDGTGNPYEMSILVSEFPHDPLLLSDFFASYGFVFIFLFLGLILGLFLERFAKDFRSQHRVTLILFGVSDSAYFSCIFGKDLIRIIMGTTMFIVIGVGSADMCAMNNYGGTVFLTIMLFALWSWFAAVGVSGWIRRRSSVFRVVGFVFAVYFPFSAFLAHFIVPKETSLAARWSFGIFFPPVLLVHMLGSLECLPSPSATEYSVSLDILFMISYNLFFGLAMFYFHTYKKYKKLRQWDDKLFFIREQFWKQRDTELAKKAPERNVKRRGKERLFPKTEDETQRKEREDVMTSKEIPQGIVIRNILDGMFAIVPKDRSLGIIGSEGSGRTSAFSHLVGISLLRHHGTVYFDGLNILRDLEPAIRNETGFITSFDWQDEDMTTMELLMFLTKLRHLPKVERHDACISVLDQLGSNDLANKRLKSLKTKERRIIDIAAAQLHRPMYIIMDEPTRGCAGEDRELLWRLLQRMMVGRMCVLFTESIEEGRFLTTRMSFIASGRLHAIGTHMELKEHFGMGYVLSVILTSPRRKSAFLGYISGTFPAAFYLPSDSEQQSGGKEDVIPHIDLQFSVERGAISQIGPFLLDLETRSQEFGVLSFTVRQLQFHEVLENIQKMAIVVKLKREKRKRKLERKRLAQERRRPIIRRKHRH